MSLYREAMVLFHYFQKAEKSITDHFQKVLNANTGSCRVESESVTGTLKHAATSK